MVSSATPQVWLSQERCCAIWALMSMDGVSKTWDSVWVAISAGGSFGGRARWRWVLVNGHKWSCQSACCLPAPSAGARPSSPRTVVVGLQALDDGAIAAGAAGYKEGHGNVAPGGWIGSRAGGEWRVLSVAGVGAGCWAAGCGAVPAAALPAGVFEGVDDGADRVVRGHGDGVIVLQGRGGGTGRKGGVRRRRLELGGQELVRACKQRSSDNEHSTDEPPVFTLIRMS